MGRWPETVRALRCFEILGITAADLHPWQRHRCLALAEATEWVSCGLMPPTPLPCFNRNCLKPMELFEYKNERALREFVVSGLCAACQATMLRVCRQESGPDDPPPPAQQPAGSGPCVWSRDRWAPIKAGVPLHCVTTVYADPDTQENPIWVAGETIRVESFWEILPAPSGRRGQHGTIAFTPGPNPPPGVPPTAQLGDGEVTFTAATGRSLRISTREFKRLAGRDELQLGFATLPCDKWGCLIVSPKIVLDFKGLPRDSATRDWVLTCMITRVPGLEATKLVYKTSHPESMSFEDATAGCPVAGALLHMMAEDVRRKEAGTFDSVYAELSVRRSPLAIFPNRAAATQRRRQQQQQDPQQQEKQQQQQQEPQQQEKQQEQQEQQQRR